MKKLTKAQIKRLQLCEENIVRVKELDAGKHNKLRVVAKDGADLPRIVSMIFMIFDAIEDRYIDKLLIKFNYVHKQWELTVDYFEY